MDADTSKGEHGRALMRYVDAELDGLGIAWTRFARDNDIPPSTLDRWRKGQTDPDMASLDTLAAVLGRPVIDMLIWAGYAPPDIVNGYTPEPVQPPSIDEAIERDPSLSSHERDILRATRELARDRAAGVKKGSRRV
jgi:transcriptional regulator with XRE-family HTH domain